MTEAVALVLSAGVIVVIALRGRNRLGREKAAPDSKGQKSVGTGPDSGARSGKAKDS